MNTKKRALTFALVVCLVTALIALVAIQQLWPTKPAVVYSLNLKDQAAVEHAVGAAIANSRTVIYVSVNWSATAAVGQYEFERFATEWQQTRPSLAVSFHCIDFTSTSTSTSSPDYSPPDYSPITSLPGRVETRRHIYGNGELVWVVDGQIVDVGVIGFGASKELIQQTDRLFAESNGDAPSTPIQ